MVISNMIGVSRRGKEQIRGAVDKSEHHGIDRLFGVEGNDAAFRATAYGAGHVELCGQGRSGGQDKPGKRPGVRFERIDTLFQTRDVLFRDAHPRRHASRMGEQARAVEQLVHDVR